MSRTQTRKKFLLIGFIPSSLECFSITKKLQRVFSRTLHFAWKFTCKWNRWRAILPQTQICKFGRTKFDTHTLSHRATRSWSFSLYFFKCCFLLDAVREKTSTVIFPTHFICVWLRTCLTISWWLEHIRNSLIIWASNENGLFWCKCAIGTQYVLM